MRIKGIRQSELRVRLPKQLTEKMLVALAVILFFSHSFFKIVLNVTLGAGTVSEVIGLVLPYVPVLMLCIIKPKKYIKTDFLVLYALILIFFGATLWVHPEYEYFYTREVYGVWPHVLSPYRGIYAYLFIRLVAKPEELVKYFRMAGWLMTVEFIYTYYAALRRGYWLGVVGSDENAKMSYSVSFGYDVLMYALVFLSCALKDRKLSDIGFAAVNIFLIFAGGSRGPVVFIILFLVLYVLIYVKESRHKVRNISLIVVFGGILVAAYENLLRIAAFLIQKVGISSRFIEKLLDGSVGDDSGRGKIWEAAIAMIKEHPLGYGAMGARHEISKVIIAGYPHNIILEILIDFGVIVGTLLLIFFVRSSVRILFHKKKKDWSYVFMPFFCSTCALMMSLTFWSVPFLWASLAVGVNCYLDGKRKKSVYEILRSILERKGRKMIKNG